MGPTGRKVLCAVCGETLGRVWQYMDERHLLFPSSFNQNLEGIWGMTRRGRKADHFGWRPYRRPVPLDWDLGSRGKPFSVATALEPKIYPMVVRCPTCALKQRIEADQIGVIVPGPDEDPEPFLTWPMTDPFELIGESGSE